MKKYYLAIVIMLCAFAINPLFAQTPFVTTWKTDNIGFSNDTSITISTNGSETYNYEVDWTYDGITFIAEDTGVTGNITHDYGTDNEGT